MQWLIDFITERPVMFARCVCYIAVAVAAAIGVIKKRHKQNATVPFSAAFPKSLSKDLRKVTKILPKETYHGVHTPYSDDTIVYSVDENTLQIPYRMYFVEPNEDKIQSLNNRQKLILYCLYTRSSNGHLREEYLKKILETDFPNWCIPYIVKLADEYVIEIVEMIYTSLKGRNNENFKEFCLNNQMAISKSYARMISYWNEYYRNNNPHLDSYIGVKLFSECFGFNHSFKK